MASTDQYFETIIWQTVSRYDFAVNALSPSGNELAIVFRDHYRSESSMLCGEPIIFITFPAKILASPGTPFAPSQTLLVELHLVQLTVWAYGRRGFSQLALQKFASMKFEDAGIYRQSAIGRCLSFAKYASAAKNERNQSSSVTLCSRRKRQESPPHRRDLM